MNTDHRNDTDPAKRDPVNDEPVHKRYGHDYRDPIKGAVNGAKGTVARREG